MTDGFEEYDDVVVTPEERQRQDEFDLMITKWRQHTSRGKSQFKYNHSEKGRLAKARYQSTEKFRHTQERYRKSERGREMLKKYSRSQNFREAQKRYRESEKGKEAERRRTQKRIANGKNAEACRRYYLRKKQEMQERAESVS